MPEQHRPAPAVERRPPASPTRGLRRREAILAVVAAAVGAAAAGQAVAAEPAPFSDGTWFEDGTGWA